MAINKNSNWPPYDLVRDVQALQRQFKQLETHAKGSAWYDFATAWTSTGTQPSLGTGNETVGHYQRIGSTCIFVIDITFVADTSFGTGQYFWSVPFPPLETSYGFVGQAHINTPSEVRYGGQVPLSAGTTFSAFFPTSGSPHTLSAMTNTVPKTLAVGDRFRVQVPYQVAEGY